MVYVITIIRCVSNIISKTQVRKLPKHLDPAGSGSATLPPTPPMKLSYQGWIHIIGPKG